MKRTLAFYELKKMARNEINQLNADLKSNNLKLENINYSHGYLIGANNALFRMGLITKKEWYKFSNYAFNIKYHFTDKFIYEPITTEEI